MGSEIEAIVETGRRRTFVSALDWPGLARSGKTEELAVQALIDAARRYAPVTSRAGESFPSEPLDVVAVEQCPGDGGTDFGVPSIIAERDRRPASAEEAERLARLVAAAWEEFDRIAASAPAELRKGPRGGGRDRDKIIAHVLEADAAYARRIGERVPVPAAEDRPAIEAMRETMLGVLRQPSDGTPLAGKRWPLRYAARYIAWHSLDHAWEMEDRTEPA